MYILLLIYIQIVVGQLPDRKCQHYYFQSVVQRHLDVIVQLANCTVYKDYTYCTLYYIMSVCV